MCMQLSFRLNIHTYTLNDGYDSLPLLHCLNKKRQVSNIPCMEQNATDRLIELNLSVRKVS